MKSTTNPPAIGSLAHSATSRKMITEATAHVQGAEAAIRKGCCHALLAGMRLIWLHEYTANTVGTNQNSKGGRDNGFDVALAEIGLARTTAYRWINATGNAALKLGYTRETFPEPGDAAWDALESSLSDVAESTSLRRLTIGFQTNNSEDQRQDHLIEAAESGDEIADRILEQVAAGDLTLVQAIRAAAGATATKGKERKDPVYLTMNASTGELGGLFVKSVTTLKNAFDHWADSPPPARKMARAIWLDLVQSLPADIKNG